MFADLNFNTFNTVQKVYYKIIKALFFSLLVYSCANRGTPVGGPKDTKPPKVLLSEPLNKTVNYSPKENISVTFDEYIVLKDVYQEMLVSPPLKDRAVATAYGKKIIVDFPENNEFDTTTYTINFGNSITDNNEGNILKNYEFVFSLKDYIDSMNVKGKIVNSFDLKTDKDKFFVMLYKNLSDSAPIKEKPQYITRSDESGNYAIHNVEVGTYRIFALKDANSNMMFDLQDEQIAFADSIIFLTSSNLISDTIVQEDNLNIPVMPSKKENEPEIASTDSVIKDTIIKEPMSSFRQELRFFKEESRNQYMTDNLRPRQEMLLFTFNQSLVDSFRIKPYYMVTENNWYVADISKTNDTIKLWLTDTSMTSKDSLHFIASYPVYDSLGKIVTKTDTLFLNYLNKEDKKTSRSRKKKELAVDETDSTKIPVKKLLLVNNIPNPSAFDLNANISISSETPIKDIKPELLQLFKIQDTLEIPMSDLKIISKTLNGFTVGFKTEEETPYKILIPDSTVFDIYGTTNDTTLINIKTQAEEFYGILTMNMKNINYPVIVQLMDDQEKIVREHKISTDQSIKYEYLYPKNYIIKLIVDSNNNGKWDTGNYLKHIQPEKVMYFPQVINVRSNWEFELNWDVKY